jgi:hypothetical protein
MGTFGGPYIVTDGLVLSLDAANPRSFRGEPTVNILHPYSTMEPLIPSINASSNYNSTIDVGGSGWDWHVYLATPDSSINKDGYMEWLPDEVDPFGNYGVWKMRKRIGINTESNIMRDLNYTCSSTLSYTLSVYCKTNVPNLFRIHLNTIKEGISYWGYRSSPHTGSNEWERLSVTIPAGEGNTRIALIRCQ